MATPPWTSVLRAPALARPTEPRSSEKITRNSSNPVKAGTLELGGEAVSNRSVRPSASVAVTDVAFGPVGVETTTLPRREVPSSATGCSLVRAKS